jgi:hypothetical protein
MSLHDNPIVSAIRDQWPAAHVQQHGGHALVDPAPHEIAAMSTASDRAGEYIESLGRTDMATWTEHEWTHFIAVVCGGYVDALMERRAAIHAACEKVTER